MQDALITMTSKGFGIAVVIQEGALLCVVTDGDLRRHMDTLMQATAGDIAGQKPVTVTPNMFAAEALNIMNTRKISVLLAVDQNNMPIGILHIHDLLRAGVA
jgi:arabinose-5-phosphate isomerase